MVGPLVPSRRGALGQRALPRIPGMLRMSSRARSRASGAKSLPARRRLRIEAGWSPVFRTTGMASQVSDHRSQVSPIGGYFLAKRLSWREGAILVAVAWVVPVLVHL